MEKPTRLALGKALNEISGITFYKDINNTLFAISDSKEKIFQINVSSKKIKDKAEKFAGPHDFEDVVRVDTTIFVLVSNGTIMAVPLDLVHDVTDSSRTLVYPFWSEGPNDFETLYYDPSVNSLIMVCKTCDADKGQKMRSAYRFDLTQRTFDSTAFYTMSTDSVKAAVNDANADFKPSAAAINPIDKQLYMLSSAGQLMVIADTRGHIKSAYKLNPKYHPQAEGIAFAPDGTMYISNEGKYKQPTLQVFPYKVETDQKKTK
jgi:uncharacterized protein YjiK